MATDYQRVQDISEKDWGQAINAAQKMCKVTKNAEKLWARYIFSKRIRTNKMDSVATYFLNQAVCLEHPKAIRLDRILRARKEHHYKLRLKAKRVLLMPDVEKFVKAVEKRMAKTEHNPTLRISTMCSHAYWNNDGLFVALNDLGDDTPYSGYSPGGPESITTYRTSYIGKTLSKIATIARRHDVNIYKDHSNFFVFFPWKKQTN